MPGIAGLFSNAPQAEHQFLAMLECLRHSPAYASGESRHPDLGLRVGWTAHPGSSGARMPVWNATRDVCLILAGEVFCDPADIEHMRSRGHRLASGPAGLLVHRYEEEGAAFVERLNGGFSGVLLDLRQRVVLLFNDRYGVGRVYLREGPDGLYFASEAKALLRLFPDCRRLDPAAVAQTVSVGCVMGNGSLFPGIELLPPASLWTFGPGRALQRRRYFSPSSWQRGEPYRSADFEDELAALFAKVLPRYFEGDQRVAMSLTGGLDGRIIMAWAKRPPGSLACYSFASPYRDCADVKIARLVANHAGQPHATIGVNEDFLDQFAALAEQCVYVSDGTMDVSGAVELHVNRAARALAPVRLTGNYGSEILRSHVAFRPRAHTPGLHPDLHRAADDAALRYRDERGSDDLSFIAFKQVPWHHHARLAVEQSQLTLRSPYLDNDLVALMHRAPPVLRRSAAVALRLIHRGDPALARMPTDRGLRHGRPSLADVFNRWVQTATVKAEYAFDYGMPPWLARSEPMWGAMAPERLFLGRHKFYHFRSWYRRPLAEYLQDTLLSRLALHRSCFEPRALQAMVRDHVGGRANHTLALHRALTIELTHTQLLERWTGGASIDLARPREAANASSSQVLP